MAVCRLNGRCHKLAVDNFVKALTGIRDAKFTHEVRNYGGIYNRRSIRGKVRVAVGSRWIAPFVLRKRKKIFKATTISLIDGAESPPFFRVERYSLINGCVTSPGAVISLVLEDQAANSVSERRVES